MQLPFTTEQFLQVFKEYNMGIFPVQIIFYLAALLVLYFIVEGDQGKSKKIIYILSFMWLWMGLVYHIIYFSEINKAAYMFGFLFILEGFMLLFYNLSKKEILFSSNNNSFSIVGWLIIIYALIVYPAFGYLNGHHYPAAPVLGAPCPTTIFTFGVLLFSDRLPKALLIIPALWAVIAFMAALKLGITEDYGLLFSGALVLGLLIFRDKGFREITN